MSIQKFLQAYSLIIILYTTASSLKQMFAELLFLRNSSQHEVVWRLCAMQKTTHLYVHTRSAAEQFHFATTFTSSLRAKHMSKDVPHVLHTRQVCVATTS